MYQKIFCAIFVFSVFFLVGCVPFSEPQKYTIDYNLSQDVINPQENLNEVEEGNSLTLKDPYRPGYIFEGWYESSTYESKVEQIQNIKNDINVYAKWTIDSSAYGNLPLIQIKTQDGVEPFDKETYINCSFSLSNCVNEEDNLDIEMQDSINDDDSVGIRLRGNSTRNMPKQPYRIKFDSKQKIMGLKKNKSWVLLADYADNSKIRNYAAFTLGNLINDETFTPNPNHVVLYLNGEYKGLYLLCEQVDEKEGRANVESDIIDGQKEFPFLLEMDRNALKEGVTGVDNFKPDYFYPVEIKYPEEDERGENGQKVFDYIQEYINAVFTTLKTNKPVKVSFRQQPVSFSDLVDVDGFIEYWLVNEIMRNQDSTWGSIYMHKTAEGKLVFGPNWDFDWSMSSVYTGKPYNSSEIDTAYTLCILSHDTPLKTFAGDINNFNLICNKWNEVKEKVLQTAEILRTYKKSIIDEAKYDANVWYGDEGAFAFDMQYDYVRLYLLDRYNYLDYVLKLK